ncbi:MAG: hypothetical protein GY913_06425 [Proteobacteria bacterium]|nr:hypothetical protein [Pseudomonadota bacterium]MCP4916541.1 hypothetical protein [Pseudomonadota bacterium]
MTLLLALSCATSIEDDGVLDLTITLEPPVSGYQVVTEPFVVEPYSEREICTVVRMEPHDGETLLWTDTLETLVSPDTHHMNVFIGQFSFLDPFVGEGAAENALGVPVGQYDCSELSVMESAFPVFPSQRENQQITLPEGVAAPLMVPALYIFSHHYVNPSDTPVRINAALNVETVESDAVDEVASLVFDAIGDIEVEPFSRQVVHRTCAMDRDVSVALVSTHTHEWGECAALSDFDGESVSDEPFFVNKDWEVPPILHFEPGSFELAAGEGIHYSCHFENDTDRTLVVDGTADGEMCVFAAVVYPATKSVQEVEDIVASGDLAGLVALMDEALGDCPGHADAVTPWDEDTTCEPFEQTESNTLR